MGCIKSAKIAVSYEGPTDNIIAFESFDAYLTKGKIYYVVEDDDGYGYIIDDEGDSIYIKYEKCAHLGHNSWTVHRKAEENTASFVAVPARDPSKRYVRYLGNKQHPGSCITSGKVYEFNTDCGGDSGYITTDGGETLFILLRGCAHLNNENWELV